MKVYLLSFIMMFLFGCNAKAGKGEKSSDTAKSKFQLIEKPAEKRVDILVDGELFTAFIYPDNIAKAVLYPIKTASGKTLTRVFPIDTIAGERVDHPHHVGHWLNYGDINGLDFWNNSEPDPKVRKEHFGRIFHTKINSAESSNNSAILDVESEWKTPDGDVLLEESTRFVFSEEGATRIIDRTTTLKALEKPVSFNDNKEGMFAIRVTRAMELPTEKPAIFLDAHGKPTKTKVLDNTGVNGDYLSSGGNTGAEVWGTRARWMQLFSTIDGEDVSLTIIDHPSNVGYPTYWHAREYGLFAANPLGQSVFTKGEKTLNFKLAPNESVTFMYRILVHSGSKLSSESINKFADDFGVIKR